MSKIDRVRALLPRARALQDAHCEMCCLHIVLSDANYADGHVRFCVEWAKEHRHTFCHRLAVDLLALSRTQRRKLRHLLDTEETDPVSEEELAELRSQPDAEASALPPRGPRIETSGPVPQVTPYTDLAIRNLYHALNQAIALLHAEADQRPWGMDSGGWEQAYVQGRVHMAEEAVNLLDAIRTAVHMTNTMGAPAVQESKR